MQPLEGARIDVLDHGFVRLVDAMGSDLSVVRAARVSFNEEWRAGEDEGSDTRLIKYLKKNKHHTPFEAVTFTFEVKGPDLRLSAMAPASDMELQRAFGPLPRIAGGSVFARAR
jgi:hypothetical protein